ncbi:MAG: stage III sporulation protein AE, partial [Ruminococcus sp.]|nr:stage III sporulation protein AE [Ruminococcus sp.]
LSYIPLMVLAMSLSGQIASGAGYYSIMLFSGQAVARIASDIIAPFMKIFLALSVASSISPNINLSGIVRYISKITKWILAFSMTVFTAILGFKQVISMGADSVSSRAVKFSLSSFVPIVGSALSEAYRTVQGSFTVLKSGVGIVAIIALIAIYLPTVLQSVFWILTLGLSKSVGEVLGLREPCFLLEAVSMVVTTLFAVILCVISIFIISTALIIVLGGFG